MLFNYKITKALPAYGRYYELQGLPWCGSNEQHFNLTTIKALKSMSWTTRLAMHKLPYE